MPALHSTTDLRSLTKDAEKLSRGQDGERYIDYGVEILTVRKSSKGAAPAPGLPKVVYVGEPLRVGGKLDTLTRRYVGPCDQWRIWLVGEKQRRIIDRFLSRSGSRHTLLYSAEGAGKTVLMSMLGWLTVFMATEAMVPGNLGATAPTSKRLGTLETGLCDLGPVSSSRDRVAGSWGTYYTDAGDLVTASGHTIQLRSTKVQSGAVGSPIQGWNWGLGALMDEGQDSLHAYSDVVARLRAGESPPIFMTATAKDSPLWRNFRDALSKNWTIDRLRFTDTPFVHDSHWNMMQEECTEREWQRRGLAMDVGPENMVYETWERAENLRPIPHIGVEDVTERVLAKFGGIQRVLVGFDPGESIDTSVLLKAYQRHGEKHHVWYIVDEVITNGTTEVHIDKLLRTLRTKWGCNIVDKHGDPIQSMPVAHVRGDPYGDTSNKTDRSVYTQFRDKHLSIRPAAYSRKTGKAGNLPKKAGIDMVCRLFCNVNGLRRLFMATDDNGRPVAPKTIEAIELSERNAAGEAEKEKKGTSNDLSHYVAALRYALWFLEKPRMGDAA